MIASSFALSAATAIARVSSHERSVGGPPAFVIGDMPPERLNPKTPSLRRFGLDISQVSSLRTVRSTTCSVSCIPTLLLLRLDDRRAAPEQRAHRADAPPHALAPQPPQLGQHAL